jgi:hypothetical protein
MRYFSYNTFKTQPGVDDYIETVSEDEIYKDYYPEWHYRMCKKYGAEVVRKDYCFEDCLDDWMTIHYAWEVKDD